MAEICRFVDLFGMLWNELMVPRRGLEPPHPCEYMHLKHARLPIPPSGHTGESIWLSGHRVAGKWGPLAKGLAGCQQRLLQSRGGWCGWWNGLPPAITGTVALRERLRQSARTSNSLCRHRFQDHA